MRGDATATDSVSIIIVNYNSGSSLTECVKQAITQARETIVVDNASTDNSLEELESAFPDDSRLKIVRNNLNLGFSAACNIGAHSATGSLLLFINPDSYLHSVTVEKLASALVSNPDVAIAGGRLLFPRGGEQGGGRRAVPTPWRSFVRAFGLSRFADRWPKLFFDFHLHKQPLPDGPIEVEAISGACCMIKRNLLEQLGFWDDGYFLHCEDLDLCQRARQKNWKILFVPDAPVVHYHGNSTRSYPITCEWHKHKGMIRFYHKFFRRQYPGLLMWLVTIGVWLRFTGVAIYYLGWRVAGWFGFKCDKKEWRA
jgi:GT2 family glycosyltransferase